MIRPVKKIFKFLTGLGLLPLCWAFSRTLYFLLQSAPAETSGWTEWALPAGFLFSALGFYLLPRPFRTYVLGHELTHALWGLFSGAKVGKMKVGKAGGHVMLSKSNFLISLAPYFFPFYTGLVIALWFAAGWFRNQDPFEVWWLAAVGLTWGFHVTFTIYMLTQRQPDIQEHGRIFSYVVIYLANLFFVALWVVLIGTPAFSSAWTQLASETAAAYNTAGSAVALVWQQIRQRE
jgi:hypothetical protein